MRKKRKDLDEVNDDFSDFSLSSPARKIRRLDAELPPIMEEEETEIPVVFEQSWPEIRLTGSVEQVGAPMIEELSFDPVNEERAIVLFKPMDAPLLHSPSNFSISSDIISGFKNHLWSSQSSHIKPAEDEAAMCENNTLATNECLAVVPWVPSQVPPAPRVEVAQAEIPELMEADEMGETTMEIEDNVVSIEQGQANEFGGMSGSEGLHQWHQQHCMTPPQLPQNTSTPIVWYRAKTHSGRKASEAKCNGL
ncbi:hypothetical protein L1049_001563 [Liquidambar formosana]|uniref:Uncharacterized protein n=1 Tax=Liquidambar formosana TaxID=63359 RepID=A0AAP0NB39_LIQFO